MDTNSNRGGFLEIPIARRKRELDGNKADSSSKAVAIPLTHYQDVQYYGELAVGTAGPDQPTQFKTFIFDTGSAWMWLPTTECQTPEQREAGLGESQCQTGSANDDGTADSKWFNHDKSSTFSHPYGKESQERQIAYGAGSITGYHARD